MTELRDRRALAAELVLGALPFAGALACMALCLPSADAAPPTLPAPARMLSAFTWGPCHTRADGGDPDAWLLVRGDRIELGVTRSDPHVERSIGRRAWGDLEADLEYVHSVYLGDSGELQIAVTSTDDAPVSFRDLLTVMAIARDVGFDDLRLDPPDRLPIAPNQCAPM